MAHPLLFQILARDWLSRLSAGRAARMALHEIPDSEIEQLRTLGFEWLYLLGVWQTGAIAQNISLANPAWRPGYQAALSNFAEQDVSGSPFAVREYQVHADFGGNESLVQFRSRLRAAGIRLMLDFVPNHTAPDHSWVASAPHRFIGGTPADLAREPDNYLAVNGGKGILAHGRDPYFPGWVDTVQLDYSNPDTHQAMTEQLHQIALQCDGVRCDMAMLVLPEVFARTWGRHMQPYWPEAIRIARQANPDFRLMAEVYWGLEWELQQQGFDYTYDKTLYDRLLAGEAGPVRQHLTADPAYQSKLARFLENHDEPRVAFEMPWEKHRAAALITYGVPGLRFFHDGQTQGFQRKPSIHLGRREAEASNPQIAAFYDRLLRGLLQGAAQGHWVLLPNRRAWESNWTDECFLCFAWSNEGKLGYLVTVNFADHQSQCLLPLPFQQLHGLQVTLQDITSEATYKRDGSELINRGLYLDLPPWGGNLFRVEKLEL